MSNGPSVGVAPLPSSLRAPVEDFGGGSAQQPMDLSEPAHALLGVYMQAKQTADQVAVEKAQAESSNWETDWLHNPDYGALNTHGEQAFGLPEQASGAFTAKAADIRSRLTNDEQRAQFDRFTDAQWNSIKERVQTHVVNEARSYDAEQSTALISAESSAAVANFTDPGRVNAAIGNTLAAIDRYGQRNGLPAEVVQQQKAEATTRIHVGIIDRMLANDQDIAARTYYDANRSEILGPQATQVEKALEEGSSRGESQKQADAILSGATNLTDAVTQARTIQDPKVRDLTEQRIRQTFIERANDQRQQSEQDMIVAGNLIDRDPGHRGQPSIPPATWATFTPAQKSSLQGYADARQAGPAKLVTDWQKWADLRDMAANPATRQAFLNIDPMTYRAKLADAQFTEIIGLREGLKNADDKTNAKLDDLSVRHGIVAQSLHGVGIDIDPKKRQADAQSTAAVYRDVDAQVETLQEKAGRRATDKEVQQITDEILTSRIVADPHWYNKSATKPKRTFELTPSDSLVLTVNDIKAADRQAITAQLRARGMPVTDDAVVKAYSDYVKGLVSRGPR